MIPAHRIEAALTEDSKLSLDNLHFRVAQAVEVIVLPVARTAASAAHPLRGTVLGYNRPAEPVTEVDWDALR